MKRNKIICLFLVILSLVVGIVAFSASAADADLTIVSKNISYDNDMKFILAIPKSQINGSVTLTVSDGAKAYSVTRTVAELQGDAITDPTIGGVQCYAVMSNYGVSLKDISREYTITVTSAGKDPAAITYSVAEYLYERLFKNEIALAADGTADADRRSLYLSTLACGASAEKVLCNLNDDPADDVSIFADGYIYSNVSGEFKLHKPGDKVTVSAYTSVYRFERSGDEWTKTMVKSAPSSSIAIRVRSTSV